MSCLTAYNKKMSFDRIILVRSFDYSIIKVIVFQILPWKTIDVRNNFRLFFFKHVLLFEA